MCPIKIVLICTALFVGISLGQHKQFPNGFEFGIATASYQTEGTWSFYNKIPGIWNTYIRKKPEMYVANPHGDIANDSYHKLEEDVEMLKELGVNFYKFSISWARVLPTGFTNHTNSTGIKYYHYLIDKLLENNITPMVTMFHWDLSESFGCSLGLMDREFVEYFKEYAKFLFAEYGDKVKYWITFNEPLSICGVGYGSALASPAVNASGIADYRCGHNLLLAHAEAYHAYYKHFADNQRGKIGIALNADWLEPNSTKPEDLLAAERAMEFQLGWFAHPIFSDEGDYPQVMKKNIQDISKLQGFDKSRLPEFSVEEVNRLKSTADFFGLNHFTTHMVADPNRTPSPYYTPSYLKDMHITMWNDWKWRSSSIPYFKIVPWGFRKLLNWINKNYKYPLLYVTENGYADYGSCHDAERIEYHLQYLENLLDAFYEDGVKVWRYAIWSLRDSFEWGDENYYPRFGLYQVEFGSTTLSRRAKLSVKFFKNVIRQKRLP